MYLFALNPDEALAVWYLIQAQPEDWEKNERHIQEVATWSEKTGKRPAVVLFLQDWSGVPDASRRAKIGELTDTPSYNPYLLFVTPSVAANTALMLVSWMQRNPHYEAKFVTHFNEGIRWLEDRRGPLPLLRQMAEEVLERARSSHVER